MLTFADFQLTDLLGSAGATIGIIIAGTIFRQFLSGKYGELLKTYRGLTQEYRSGAARHTQLQRQIRGVRHRLYLLNWASSLSAMALLCFLAPVIAGELFLIIPGISVLKWFAAAGLFAGLAIMGSSMVIELAESIAARIDIVDETDDLDDPVK